MDPTTPSDAAPSDTAGPARTAGRAWLVVALLSLLMLANFAAKIGVGLAGAPLKKDLGIGDAGFGVVQSSFFWLFAVGSVLGGWLGGKVSARWLLGGIALLWAVSLSPMTGQIGFTGAVACRVLLGFAEGPTLAIALQAAHSWFPAQRRALPTAVVLLGAGAGPLVASPVLTAVIKNQSWHAGFGVLAVFGGAVALLWLLLGSEGPEDTGTDTAAPQPRPLPDTVPLRRLFATRTMAGALALLFVAYADAATKLSWLPLYFEKGLGYDTSTTGVLVALPFLGASIALVTIGFASRALTRRGHGSRLTRGVMPSAVVLVGALLTLVYPWLGRGPLFVTVLTLSTCCIGGGYAIVFAGLSDLVPARRRTAAFGIVVAVYSLGAVIAPAFVGALVAAAHPALAGYRSAFLIIGAALVVGSTAGLLLIDPERDAARLATRSTPVQRTEPVVSTP
ncbi:MFS transporter [Streptacidiphilus anmyonensis]|uniref:MFS transporter n=1 Tax=Streptacidiphilus anmyonensis TaxID=405782 RepID=UPI0005A75808|nr:MFS transporter [Streptacidiphilus anmyonensis]